MSSDQIPAVSVADLPADLSADGAPLLVDVREPDEWSAGHIADALHIPMGELVTRLDEVPREQDVVVVCRSGGRSAAVTGYLVQGGWQVRNLTDGMLAWQAHGRPMVSESGAAPRVL
ncbi:MULTISPECIES: rhodanese-like domain-containing protein [Frankia]|uniref:Metallo-beta-lactamase rhodanese-like domain protein n=2 Tax=Frankia TaxID=1854 RepID=Q0RB28_FRAAA|nr:MULTISPECIES: rhodanese-like domain-containing protein [Frankia]CAJ65360.1 putative Metallo-beta-lactamase; rhodanese-like domain protein [Frankia alni ACN14a]